MAFGTSIFLFAVGAILRFAVTADAEGIDLQTVGTILMWVGVIGFVISALFFASWSPWGSSRYERRTVVRDRDSDYDRDIRV